MGVFAALRSGTDQSDEPRRARCRNCGRYYDAADELCPHCGSGNKILGGAPSGQTSH